MPNTTYYYYSDINSFPTTKMESVNKLITENSLTRLINRLLDIDGFIITDGLAMKDYNETIGNGGKHLKINSNLKIDQIKFQNDLLEFVIRGYYFSIDIKKLETELRNYIDINHPGNSVGLFARIFIDNTNVNYPELVGQTAYEEHQGDEQNPFSEGKHYGVQFFICRVDPDSKPEPFHPVLSDPTTGIIEGLGINYLYFDLLLLKYIYNDNTEVNGIYVPFESLCKFDSHSVNIIDGGVLKLYDN